MNQPRPPAARGSALLVCVIVLMATLMTAMGALLTWSLSGYRHAVNRTMRTRMLYTAESGCQYALASLQMYVAAYETHPTSTDFARIVAEFSAVSTNMLPRDIRLVKFEIDEGITYWTNSIADSLYRGLRASVKPIYVTVGVESIANTDIYVEINQTIDARSFSIFEYGVFVDGDLLINSDKKMEIQGAVHANGNLSLGTRAAMDGLHLASFVTSASNIYAVSHPGSTTIDRPDGTAHEMQDGLGFTLDSRHLFWKTLAINTWGGRVMSSVHGIPYLSLPVPGAMDDPRVLIDPPLATDTPEVSGARYANRAAVRIVDTGDIQKYSTNTSSFVTIGNINSVAWAKTNNYFWNNSIERFVTPLDIDVAALNAWLKANANDSFFTDSSRAGVFYVAITNKLGSAVRLNNASSLPNSVISGITNGFTFATANPLYLNGNYNDVTVAPAAVLSDALTVLSSNWKDSEHLATNSARGSCRNTSYFTAMITGQITNYNTFTGEDFFGGVEDLPKYIEDWKGTGASGNKEIRGTISSLWASKWERMNWVVPDTSPNRFWWYDPSFGYPPGSPRFHEFMPKEWNRSARR